MWMPVRVLSSARQCPSRVIGRHSMLPAVVTAYLSGPNRMPQSKGGMGVMHHREGTSAGADAMQIDSTARASFGPTTSVWTATL